MGYVIAKKGNKCMVKVKCFVKDEKSAYIINEFLNINFPEYITNNFNMVDSKDIFLFFVEVNNIFDLKNFVKLHDECLKQTSESNIIFISNDDMMIFDLLVYKPLYFIRASKLQEDLLKMKIVLKENLKTSNTVTIKSGTAIIRLNLKNVYYIESLGHYLIIHTQSGKYKIREKLVDFINRMNSLIFVRTHKSYAININFIDKLFSSYILLKSCDKIPIGRNFKKNVQEILKIID